MTTAPKVRTPKAIHQSTRSVERLGAADATGLAISPALLPEAESDVERFTRRANL